MAAPYTFCDGVYEGKAKGYRGDTHVKVTVENGEIVSIDILSFEDYREFIEPSANFVISQILKKQTVDVQTVGGCTFSSKSIINAVRDALSIPVRKTRWSSGG